MKAVKAGVALETQNTDGWGWTLDLWVGSNDLGLGTCQQPHKPRHVCPLLQPRIHQGKDTVSNFKINQKWSWLSIHITPRRTSLNFFPCREETSLALVLRWFEAAVPGVVCMGGCQETVPGVGQHVLDEQQKDEEWCCSFDTTPGPLQPVLLPPVPATGRGSLGIWTGDALVQLMEGAPRVLQLCQAMISQLLFSYPVLRRTRCHLWSHHALKYTSERGAQPEPHPQIPSVLTQETEPEELFTKSILAAASPPSPPAFIKEGKTKHAYKQVNGMKHLLSVQGVLNELISASQLISGCLQPPVGFFPLVSR